MTKTRRIAVAIIALLAGSFVAPALASAAPRMSPSFKATRGMTRPQDARAYASHTHQAINNSVRRIKSNPMIRTMSAQQRTLLNNNTNNSANILRARLATITADGKVTASENKQMRDLAAAVQFEMRKAHGNIDSFWML